MEKKPFQVTICGDGNQAHIASAFIASHDHITVNLFTKNPEKWHQKVTAIPNANSKYKKTIEGNLNIISNDPAAVSKNTKVFIICSPSSEQESVLQQLYPFIEKNTYIGTCSSQYGFDLICNFVFGEKLRYDNITVFALENMPIISSIQEYGKHTEYFSIKKILYVATLPIQKNIEMCSYLEQMYDIVSIGLPNFLNLALAQTSSLLNPARIYGLFRDWDGTTPISLDNIPLLYEQYDQFSANILQLLDDEVQQIKEIIKVKFPAVDLNFVQPIKARLLEQYGDNIKDKSTLQTIIQTNQDYQGLKLPLKQKDNGYVLDIKGRFFEEDIPYGLCILKNIASFVQFHTPIITKLIQWFQQFMKRKFIVNGQLDADTIQYTGCPSKYGIVNIEDLIFLSSYGAKL